jgi:hypothetical protein
MNLRAHLRHELMLSSKLGKPASLDNGVRKRLFTINVLPQLHRHRSGRRMGVVRRRHHHGVDLLQVGNLVMPLTLQFARTKISNQTGIIVVT